MFVQNRVILYPVRPLLAEPGSLYFGAKLPLCVWVIVISSIVSRQKVFELNPIEFTDDSMGSCLNKEVLFCLGVSMEVHSLSADKTKPFCYCSRSGRYSAVPKISALCHLQFSFGFLPLSMKRNARQPREQEQRSARRGCGTEDDKHPKAQGWGEIRKQKDPEP